MIKNTLLDKSGIPENLKKQLEQFKSFSTAASMVGEDLLRAFYRLFFYSFVIQVISEKTLCRKNFTKNLRDIFTWK